MLETTVCGRWPLKLAPGTGGFYAYLQTASSKNAACFFELIQSLPQGLSVVEHFGGVGIFSTIIQNTIHPRTHLIFDVDDDCVNQLRSALDRHDSNGNHVTAALKGDAHLTMGNIAADLVVCDFPYATIKHHSEWPWETLFSHRPRYVVWSDTACRRLGLHRSLYARLFHSPVLSHRDYVLAYSKLMWERYGYSVTRCTHHVYSYLLAEPVPYAADIEIIKVPA